MIVLNRRRVMGGSLPYDTEIEYLESTGTQYIDTGIYPSETLPFDVVFYSYGNTAEYGYGNVFAARQSAQRSEYQVTTYNNGVVGIGSLRNLRTMALNTINHVIFDGATTLSVNGTISTIAKTAIDKFYNIYLYGINQNGVATQLSKTRIYSCTFGNVRDFIPVRVGNVGYMYDKVSKQLFGNSGTGNFILGGDV